MEATEKGICLLLLSMWTLEMEVIPRGHLAVLTPQEVEGMKREKLGHPEQPKRGLSL